MEFRRSHEAGFDDLWRQSFHSETFDFEHHCRWLEQKLESPGSLCLIGIDGQRPVGTIRFEIDRKTALVSFTVAPVERGVVAMFSEGRFHRGRRCPG